MNMEEKLHNATQEGGDRMVEKMALTIEEAAECSGIGRNTLRQLARNESFPVLHIGAKMLIMTDTLKQFLQVNQGIDLLDPGSVKTISKKIS